MKSNIDYTEWHPVYVPDFVEKYDTLYETSPHGSFEFSEEEVYKIKNAFLLFQSAQDILKEKYDTRSKQP